MTLRAVIFGMLGACFICGFTYFNDAVMKQTYLVGNHLPIAVYGGLILVVLLINPLLSHVFRCRALSAAELTLILALTVAACCIPGSGLMRTFTASLVMPHHFNQVEPAWSENRILDMVAPQMLVDLNNENQSYALGGFIQGLPRVEGQRHIELRDIPWSAWARTLLFWLPLILALWIALVGLSVVVHRQWSDHEHLSYPIAAFTDALLPKEGRLLGSAFGSRLFWIGAVAVFAIHANNFVALYFPEDWITVQRGLNLHPLVKLFPNLAAGGGGGLLSVPIYFTVVAFSFFLATDVSLSLGLGPFLYAYLSGLGARYGIALGSDPRLSVKPERMMMFGAYLGAFLGLLFTARHYYATIFRKVLRPVGSHADAVAVWGARVCLVGLAVFVVLLVGVGVDWQIAILYALLMVIHFVVMSRILAETGVFFIQAWWTPCIVIAGFLGVRALGTKTYLILLLASAVLALDPREALMPFMVNSLKLLDMHRVRIGRAALLCGVALVVGLVVAVPVTLYFQYDRGMNAADPWATRTVPSYPFVEAVRVKQRLDAQDSSLATEPVFADTEVGDSGGSGDSGGGWQRFAGMRPDPKHLIAFAAGLIAVAIFTLLRLRLPWWPLHPVLFLTWATYPGRMMALSFIVGWMIKVLVTKYGGAGGYQRLKPLMMGLVAGEILGGLAPILVGTVSYVLTGLPPHNLRILPG